MCKRPAGNRSTPCVIQNTGSVAVRSYSSQVQILLRHGTSSECGGKPPAAVGRRAAQARTGRHRHQAVSDAREEAWSRPASEYLTIGGSGIHLVSGLHKLGTPGCNVPVLGGLWMHLVSGWHSRGRHTPLTPPPSPTCGGGATQEKPRATFWRKQTASSSTWPW